MKLTKMQIGALTNQMFEEAKKVSAKHRPAKSVEAEADRVIAQLEKIPMAIRNKFYLKVSRPDLVKFLDPKKERPTRTWLSVYNDLVVKSIDCDTVDQLKSKVSVYA